MSWKPTPPQGYRLVDSPREKPHPRAKYWDTYLSSWNKRQHPESAYSSFTVYAVPIEQVKAPKPSGLDLIAAERQRQISVEGYTPEHDAEHVSGELLIAAVCYLRIRCPNPWVKQTVSPEWPFEFEALKPTANQVGNLVKAGALIAAEIDRIQAAESRSAAEASQSDQSAQSDHSADSDHSAHSPDCDEPSCFGCYDVESV